MMKKKLTIPLAALALILSASGGIATVAQADTSTARSTTSATMGHGGAHRPTAFGTVVSVSGSTITMTDARTGSTYTVNTSGAKLTKSTTTAAGQVHTAPTAITVADILPGDTLAVHGTASGTTITATSVRDGLAGKKLLM